MPADKPCPRCDRMPAPRFVLNGWRPCGCGGHSTFYCDVDGGGCGVREYAPPLGPDCAEVINAGLPNPYIRR